MDCDLQDRPEEIIKLYEKTKEGYDLVVGKRKIRKDSYFRKFMSNLYYFVFNRLSDLKISNNILNFGVYSSQVIKSVQISELSTSIDISALWVGLEEQRFL